MSASNNIKKELIKKISACGSVNKVYGFEKINPTGFPAVFVTVAGVENEFFTNAENKRIFGFRALVLFQGGQNLLAQAQSDQMEEAELGIQDLLGEIIDAVDSDYTLGDYIQVLFVEAAVGEFGYVEYEGGWARTAEINLRVHSIYVV